MFKNIGDIHNLAETLLVNPPRMRNEGYGTWFVCVCLLALSLALRASV